MGILILPGVGVVNADALVSLPNLLMRCEVPNGPKAGVWEAEFKNKEFKQQWLESEIAGAVESMTVDCYNMGGTPFLTEVQNG